LSPGRKTAFIFGIIDLYAHSAASVSGRASCWRDNGVQLRIGCLESVATEPPEDGRHVDPRQGFLPILSRMISSAAAGLWPAGAESFVKTGY